MSDSSDTPARFWVAAGQTQPNYYPDWNLSPRERYEVHLGTRFMLVMQVAIAQAHELPNNLTQSVERLIGTVAPQSTIEDIIPAAAFHVEDDLYAVCRATVDDTALYVIGFDAPPGIYRQTHLPPHIIFRLHLGKIICHEAHRQGDL